MPSLSTSAGDLNPKNFEISLPRSSQHDQRYYKNGVYQSTLNSVLRQLDFNYESYHGKVIKDFHKRKARGELLPMTWYNRVTQTSECTVGFREHYFTDSFGVEHRYKFIPVDSALPLRMEVPGGHPTVVGSPTVNIYDLAIDRGYDPRYFVSAAAAKAYSSGWDVSTWMAELHQVKRMFSNIVNSIINLDSTIGLVNAWLEGRYGWRILMYDIQDMARAIQRLDEDALSRVKERTGTTLVWTDDFSVDYEYGSNTSHVAHYVTHELGIRGRLIADFTPPNFSFNPFVTAWELVPYSFVIDWLLNVGQAINAVSFKTLADSYTAAVGLYYQRTSSYDLTYTAKPPWTVEGQSSYREQLTSIMRKPTTVPNLPPIHLNLNVFKVFDIIALLAQFADRLYKR